MKHVFTPSTTPSTASFASSATSLTLETTFSAAPSFQVLCRRSFAKRLL